jgi:hypothetical protein
MKVIGPVDVFIGHSMGAGVGAARVHNANDGTKTVVVSFSCLGNDAVDFIL